MKYFRPLTLRNLKFLVVVPVLLFSPVIYFCLYILTLGSFDIWEAMEDTSDWIVD